MCVSFPSRELHRAGASRACLYRKRSAELRRSQCLPLLAVAATNVGAMETLRRSFGHLFLMLAQWEHCVEALGTFFSCWSNGSITSRLWTPLVYPNQQIEVGQRVRKTSLLGYRFPRLPLKAWCVRKKYVNQHPSSRVHIWPLDYSII